MNYTKEPRRYKLLSKKEKKKKKPQNNPIKQFVPWVFFSHRHWNAGRNSETGVWYRLTRLGKKTSSFLHIQRKRLQRGVLKPKKKIKPPFFLKSREMFNFIFTGLSPFIRSSHWSGPGGRGSSARGRRRAAEGLGAFLFCSVLSTAGPPRLFLQPSPAPASPAPGPAPAAMRKKAARPLA